MVLKDNRLLAAKVAQLVANLHARFTPIGAKVFDDVRGFCWFTGCVGQALQREHTDIKQLSLIATRVRLFTRCNPDAEQQENHHEDRPW